MGKVKELWMNELEKLQENYCEANITEEEFRRGMYNLGADKIDVDCFIIEAELLRSINKAFKPVFRDAKPEV
jgi:hypothetical protein